MDKRKIQTAINVAAVILVPLINERKRIKDHEDVQKFSAVSKEAFNKTKHAAGNVKEKAVHVTEKAVHTGAAIKNTTVSTTQFVSSKVSEQNKKRNYDKAMNAHKKVEKDIEKEKKETAKLTEKMDTQLYKEIKARRETEDKERSEREKQMIKEMKKYKNYKASAVKEQNHQKNDESKNDDRRQGSFLAALFSSPNKERNQMNNEQKIEDNVNKTSHITNEEVKESFNESHVTPVASDNTSHLEQFENISNYETEAVNIPNDEKETDNYLDSGQKNTVLPNEKYVAKHSDDVNMTSPVQPLQQSPQQANDTRPKVAAPSASGHNEVTNEEDPEINKDSLFEKHRSMMSNKIDARK